VVIREAIAGFLVFVNKGQFLEEGGERRLVSSSSELIGSCVNCCALSAIVQQDLGSGSCVKENAVSCCCDKIKKG